MSFTTSMRAFSVGERYLFDVYLTGKFTNAPNPLPPFFHFPQASVTKFSDLHSSSHQLTFLRTRTFSSLSAAPSVGRTLCPREHCELVYSRFSLAVYEGLALPSLPHTPTPSNVKTVALARFPTFEISSTENLSISAGQEFRNPSKVCYILVALIYTFSRCPPAYFPPPYACLWLPSRSQDLCQGKLKHTNHIYMY